MYFEIFFILELQVKVTSLWYTLHTMRKEAVLHNAYVGNGFSPLHVAENPTELSRVPPRPLKHISLLCSTFLYCSRKANEMFHRNVYAGGLLKAFSKGCFSQNSRRGFHFLKIFSRPCRVHAESMQPHYWGCLDPQLKDETDLTVVT